MSRLAPARVEPRMDILERTAKPVERKWRSVEAALAYYFLWGPRLQSARSRNFYSIEDLEAAVGDGSPSCAEDLRLSVADIGRCLAVLDDEESFCLSVTFGISPGARRVERDGVVCYEEDETLLNDRRTRVTRDATKTRAYSSDTPLRQRARSPRDAVRRARGELSWKEAARRMGWVAASGEADHKKVQRVLRRARAKIREQMEQRKMLEVDRDVA